MFADVASFPDPDAPLAQETYGELSPFVRREWLLTNGLGGFASGTVADVNTRRYHAGLVAATQPPVGRVIALSRWASVLRVGERRHDLWGGYFRGNLKGHGPAMLRRFRLLDDTAQWEFDVGGVKVFKELFVCWHRDAAAVRFRVRRDLTCDEPVRLEVSPLTTLRSFHKLRRAGDAEFELSSGPGGCRMANGELALHVWQQPPAEGAPAATPFDAAPDWWYAQTYPMEAARGLDDREDLFTPGTFALELPAEDAERAITLWARLGDGDEGALDLDDERGRRRHEMRLPPMPTVNQRLLVRAAADFVVKRRRPDGAAGTTILAGYPFASDWGRDTFVALPGLLLSTGRHQTAGQVLCTFAMYVDGGMIPNRFDELSNEPSYDTVDASLWFVHAAHQYLAVTRDRDTFQSVLLPACEAIIEGYRRGTRYGIAVDPVDGLLTCDGERLTWMEGEVDGHPATPRAGKAVEINALWHNALCLLGEPCVSEAFRAAFVLPDGRGLADRVTGRPGAYERDESLRPNQIFAVSLPHSPLDDCQQQATVDVVRRALLTPYGLRTLDPRDPRYVARYTGPDRQRRAAMHNGVVWPWLIGPFIDAHLRINRRDAASLRRARTWIRPLLEHLRTDGCLGSIAEMCDAHFPYRPGNAFAQAWSVAEVLRLAVELEL